MMKPEQIGKPEFCWSCTGYEYRLDEKPCCECSIGKAHVENENREVED